ncbi:30S ribosomal protein S19, partial [Candidatus Micrarchaeota archaeon]|nr:30S ribosomal protein S19 [Candidatus Micrarchaeota archaeon]
FTFKGKTIDELSRATLEELAKLVRSRQRRSLKRGFTEPQKKLLKTIRSVRTKGRQEKPIRTHVRDMIILPEMVGMLFNIHDGKDWNRVEVTPQMLGHYLGEFTMTRERVTHSGPGIGATRGTKFISVK